MTRVEPKMLALHTRTELSFTGQISLGRPGIKLAQLDIFSLHQSEEANFIAQISALLRREAISPDIGVAGFHRWDLQGGDQEC